MSARALLVAALAALAACGDPLTDGAWRGTPAIIVRGAVEPIDDDGRGATLVLAVVWAPLGEALDASPLFPIRQGDVDDGPEVGSFALSLYAEPPDGATGDDDLPLAVGLLTIVEAPERGWPTPIGPAALGERVRAVSGDHYVVWVRDASAVRERVAPFILNPIALEDGYNLAVGLCRPGRPSQVIIVQPERVTLEAVSTPDRGDCLDVYWGDWRAP